MLPETVHSTGCHAVCLISNPSLALNTFHSVMKLFVCVILPPTGLSEDRGLSSSYSSLSTEHRALYIADAQKCCLWNGLTGVEMLLV